MYDTIIIGGGPAGVTAGVYAMRKKLKTLVLAESFGGQSVASGSIGNWIGEVSISGVELAQKLEAHLRAQEGIIIKSERVESVSKKDDFFEVKTAKDIYTTKIIIVCSGGRHRHLNVPGEQEFDGKGVVYCSTCDAPLFNNKAVAVVGTGNSGLEAIQDLIPYAAEIYLLNRGAQITGDPLTFEKIQASDKFKDVIHNAEILEILGDKFVTGLKYKDLVNNQEKTLVVQGVFVEIGAVPNSEILGDLVDKNKFNEIIVDHQTNATSCPGIFAAGDVTDALYKQNNISVGDAVKASLSAYNYLQNKNKQ